MSLEMVPEYERHGHELQLANKSYAISNVPNSFHYPVVCTWHLVPFKWRITNRASEFS